MADRTLGAGGQSKFLVVSPEDRERSVRALRALQDEVKRAESRIADHLLRDNVVACGCGERRGVTSFCKTGLDLYGELAKWTGVATHARGALEAMGVPNLPGKDSQLVTGAHDEE